MKLGRVYMWAFSFQVSGLEVVLIFVGIINADSYRASVTKLYLQTSGYVRLCSGHPFVEWVNGKSAVKCRVTFNQYLPLRVDTPLPWPLPFRIYTDTVHVHIHATRYTGSFKSFPTCFTKILKKKTQLQALYSPMVNCTASNYYCSFEF